MEPLHTERLTLVALENRTELEWMLGGRVPQAWPGSEPTRLIVHAADRILIGAPVRFPLSYVCGSWSSTER